jgi:DNA-directed RNA polymerase specialized sigma24 family protein
MDSRAGVDSTEIKPLTKRTGEGVLYIRRPDAELQIEKTLTLSRPQILQMVAARKRRDESDYLLDETIVYFLREARINDDGEMIEALFAELNRRIWKLLAKFRAGNEADFEDFVQRVEMAILEKIFDMNSNAADFAQVQFGSFVLSEAKAVWKGNLVKLKREQELFETTRAEGDESEDENRLENISGANDLPAESRLIIAEGLKKLAPHQRTVAVMLLDGFQIESKNAGETTISGHLGVSSRTIRNWIKEMRAALEGYQGEAERR